MADAVPMTPIAELLPGSPVDPGAPARAGDRGIFAGMLAQRMPPAGEGGEAVADGESPAIATLPGDAAAAAMPAENGLSPDPISPPDGKGLPPAGEAGLRTIDLLAALASSVAGGRETTTAPGDEGMPVTLPRMGEGLADSADNTGDPASAPVTPLMPTAAAADAPPFPPVASPMNAVSPTGVMPPAVAGIGPERSPRPLPAAELRLAALRDALNTRPGERMPATVAAPRDLPVGLTASGESFPRGVAEAIGRPLNLALTSGPLGEQVDRLLAGGVKAAAPSPLGERPALAVDVASPAPADPDGTGIPVLPGMGGETRPHGAAGSGPALPVATVVGQPGWSAELGQRLVWLAGQEIREAKIQLNPRHLGPVDVRIVYGDAQQVSVSFSAHNPAARDALDAALPRLREMFEQQGLNLADASVSQESFARHGQRDDRPGAGQAGHGRDAGSTTTVATGASDLTSPPTRVVARGLLDAFA